MWLMNRTKKFKEFFGIKRDFRYNISFIDPERGVFDEIFPEVMIFPITSGNISSNTPRSGFINDKDNVLQTFSSCKYFSVKVHKEDACITKLSYVYRHCVK